jgi:hypothetical protein
MRMACSGFDPTIQASSLFPVLLLGSGWPGVESRSLVNEGIPDGAAKLTPMPANQRKHSIRKLAFLAGVNS